MWSGIFITSNNLIERFDTKRLVQTLISGSLWRLKVSRQQTKENSAQANGGWHLDPRLPCAPSHCKPQLKVYWLESRFTMSDSKGSQGSTSKQSLKVQQQQKVNNSWRYCVCCLYIITRYFSCLSTLVPEYRGWKNTTLLDRQLKTISLAVFYTT